MCTLEEVLGPVHLMRPTLFNLVYRLLHLLSAIPALVRQTVKRKSKT